MAPYDFEAPDADTILRCSDGKELRVHKVVLSLASPVFRDMFSLPQPAEPSHTPIVDVPETSDILAPLVQHFYPCSPPKVPDLRVWDNLYTVADKYNAEAATELLRDILISRFLKTAPFRVYALASRWGLEEEAKVASWESLKMDISKGIPEEDAKLMGVVAFQKLYHLHVNCRDRARALINDNPYTGGCVRGCPPFDFDGVVKVLSHRVSAKPRLTIQSLYSEIAAAPRMRGCSSCPNSLTKTHEWASKILRLISELPQTIE